jgi:hypothetical protein
MKPIDSSRQLYRQIRKNLLDKFLYDRSPKWLSSPEYARRFSCQWYKVYEKMPNHRPALVYHGSLRVDVAGRLDSEFPETGVLELNNALLYGCHGWIFSREGYLLSDHSWYGRHVNEMRKVPNFLPKGKRLSGVCLSLASDFAVGGYGHFVTDCIPRLELFYRAGFKLTDVDYVFCPKPTPGNAQNLFKQLDIPASKLIWADNNKALQVDTLLAPTFPGTRRNYPKWVTKFLQQQFLPLPPSQSRRLYISRDGYRRNPTNAEAVNRILLRYGFEIYQPEQHPDSHRDFAEATMIVGASGSGLTGLVFCQPGTKVLELIPTDHVYPYYYTISDAAGLDYSCLVCPSNRERNPDAVGPSPSNFYVNEDELANTLALLTGEA